MFKDKKSLPQDVQPESDNPAKEKDTGPRISGNFMGYKPQWKHCGFGAAVNKGLLKMEGGDKWTNVPFTIHRGGIAVQLPDGTQIPVGIPFPRYQPGVLETIHLCGHEQAMALAWSFAAHIASVGGEVEVRAEEYELTYEIKAKLYEGKKAEQATIT